MEHKCKKQEFPLKHQTRNPTKKSMSNSYKVVEIGFLMLQFIHTDKFCV